MNSMDLYEAVNKAVKEFGEQVITEPRFVSILCDYHGFDTIRPAKTVIGNAVRLGYMDKLLSNHSDPIKLASVIADYIQETGFEKELVKMVFTQIASVLLPRTHSVFDNIYPPIRQLPFVFIIDASQDISDYTVKLINFFIEQFVATFSFLDEIPDAHAAIACMSYGKHAHWLDESSSNFSAYKWKGISRDGKGNVSEAFILLKDSFKYYFQKKIFDPIIILISASKAIGDYETVLQNLSHYYEYEYATRIGIKFGDSCDMKLLTQFASSNEHIVDLNNLERLKKYIVPWYSYPDLFASDVPIKSFFE